MLHRRLTSSFEEDGLNEEANKHRGNVGERNADRTQIRVNTALKLHKNAEGAVIQQEAKREAPKRCGISVRLTVQRGHLLFSYTTAGNTRNME